MTSTAEKPPAFRPDGRKSLDKLCEEWYGCTRCKLGERRAVAEQYTKAHQAFGEGVPEGVMLIGEAPREEEEAEGRPISGRVGDFLRQVLPMVGLTQTYVTNLVLCRSAIPAVDGDGKPIIRRDGVQWRDQPPLPSHIEACSERLFQEIYKVDPILIVAMGQKVTEFLRQRKIAMVNESGKDVHIQIPGAGYAADVTEVKGVWVRKVKKEWAMPVVQNAVTYLLIPITPPSLVLTNLADTSKTGMFARFIEELRRVSMTFQRYHMEIRGVELPIRDLPLDTDDQVSQLRDELFPEMAAEVEGEDDLVV